MPDQISNAEDILAALAQVRTTSFTGRVQLFLDAMPNLSKKDLRSIVPKIYALRSKMQIQMDEEFRVLVTAFVDKAE